MMKKLIPDLKKAKSLQDKLAMIKMIGENGSEKELIYLTKNYSQYKGGEKTIDEAISKLYASVSSSSAPKTKKEAFDWATIDAYEGFGGGISGVFFSSLLASTIVLELMQLDYGESERAMDSIKIALASGAIYAAYKTAKLPFFAAKNFLDMQKRKKVEKAYKAYQKRQVN